MNRPAIALAVFASTGSLCAAATEVRIPREHGDLIVRSTGETAYRPSGPAPDFASLDNDGNGFLDEREATGYALLANDFLMADGNRDGRVSRREYQQWSERP